MEDRVRFALENLLNIAHDDTGQGRRGGELPARLVERRGARRLRHRRPVRRRPRGLGGHGDDLHLSGERRTPSPTDYRGEIESIIKRWRPETV